MSDTDQRPGEIVTAVPDRPDAGVYFIGRIRTPWPERRLCPRRGDLDGPECRVEIDPRWAAALQGIEAASHLQLLYWMHLARRDLIHQRPRASGRLIGTFALRSPVRPNPIGCSTVRLLGRRGDILVVQGLDCVDGTPLIDVKPDRCPAWDVAGQTSAAAEPRGDHSEAPRAEEPPQAASRSPELRASFDSAARRLAQDEGRGFQTEFKTGA